MSIPHYFPSLGQLTKRFGTPFYLYDFTNIQQQYLKIKGAFAGRKSLIAYALKANSNLSVVQQIASLGGGADCVSLGEIKRAILAGVKPYHIIFSGVGKRKDEILEALHLNILFINVESEDELLLVEKIASSIRTEARISLRVNPNINPKTHPYISTGLNENKFGIPVQEAKRLYLYAHKSPHLKPVGIHFHIGSQLLDLEPLQEATQKISSLFHSLNAIGLELKFFDVGGGLGINYTDEKPIEPYDYAQMILKELRGTEATIICEPGRFIVGNSGYLITSVLYEKINDSKRFVIVDTAMNDLIRPTLYDAIHQIALFDSEKIIDTEILEHSHCTLADVVGPICESGDFLAKNIKLPPLKHNNLLIIKNAGAYGFTMASHYNTRPNPPEIAFNDQKKVWVIRSKERLESLWENELAYLKDKQ
ncbi:diaminopimelate decarboxylase [Helicobacter monodelphidis]|uniref:diaminopimelate decarboxylase n=1 Tax=Helicobacter sp. 15-1451 TaxID=2004995 RepID=UPI000DCB5BB4|nr:diaminopimelate decarboxylase [Helicobacter sp. 15-1451]RAX56758.1 diaminopimelate decarboxylase [Helicobacter sp. 15-1451]